MPYPGRLRWMPAVATLALAVAVFGPGCERERPEYRNDTAQPPGETQQPTDPAGDVEPGNPPRQTNEP